MSQTIISYLQEMKTENQEVRKQEICSQDVFIDKLVPQMTLLSGPLNKRLWNEPRFKFSRKGLMPIQRYL